ncbi:MAG: carbohydrate ABC transporter permease [Clostridia bacterium]|nr:carbohydrate ABC transporter permease [Clostridia bacterium]
MKKSSIKNKSSWFSALLFAVLIVFSVILVFLLLWALNTSVKNDRDFTIGQNYFGLPKDYFTEQILAPWQWEWKNFTTIIQYFTVTGVQRNGMDVEIPFQFQVFYTLMYTVGSAFFNVLCPCLVAYARRKYDYGFLKIFDAVVIITMIIPIVGSQASMLSFLHSLNIYDTFLGLYIQKFYFANMYYFVFLASFKSVSKEYFEAASIDGANEFQTMLKVGLPLILNTFGLIFLLKFVEFWNDYQTLLVYAPSHPSITYALFRVLTDSSGNSDRGSTPVQMAGCVIVTLPVVVLFIIFKDKLMGNISMGGVKE